MCFFVVLLPSVIRGSNFVQKNKKIIHPSIRIECVLNVKNTIGPLEWMLFGEFVSFFADRLASRIMDGCGANANFGKFIFIYTRGIRFLLFSIFGTLGACLLSGACKCCFSAVPNLAQYSGIDHRWDKSGRKLESSNCFCFDQNRDFRFVVFCSPSAQN